MHRPAPSSRRPGPRLLRVLTVWRAWHALPAAVALLAAPAGWAQGADHGADHAPAPAAAAPAPAATPAAAADSAQALSEGVVTRWDARSGKLTLRHGELHNLGMPPMTMVFTLREPAQVGALQPGDAVRFRAERVQGAFVITHLERAR